MTETKELKPYTEDKQTCGMQKANEKRTRMWGIVFGLLLYIILLFLLFQVAGLVLFPHENPYDNPVFGWLANGGILPCLFAGQYFLYGRHCEEEKKVRERTELAGLFAGYIVWLSLTAAALYMGFGIPREPNIFAGYFIIILFIAVIEWRFERRWSRDMLIMLACLLFIGVCLVGVVFIDTSAVAAVTIPGATDVLTEDNGRINGMTRVE